jgi:hypothetical protein
MFRVTNTPRLTLALACVALLVAACGTMALSTDEPAPVEEAPADSQPEEATPHQADIPTPTPEQAPPAGEEKGADETPDSSTDDSGEPPKVDCPGALPARLTVGEPGRVTFSNGLSVRVREEPSTDESVTVLFMLPEGTVFTVIGGPECADNWLWWEIEMANGVSGWASEGSRDQGYFLEPFTP